MQKSKDVKFADSIWFPFVVSFIVVWPIFSINEIIIPQINASVEYEKKCRDAGGFVYDRQNQDRICIHKDYIIIP
jgi:hypothetical protein